MKRLCGERSPMTDIFVPPEWAPRKALWTAWPSHADLWGAELEPARSEVRGLVSALAQVGGDRVRVLVAGEQSVASAQAAVGAFAEIVPQAFGDIWLRDTGPIFARKSGKAVALGFRFNGWGGKYELEGDEMVAAAIAAKAQTPLIAHEFVLEGGAVEMDGEGTLLTTRQCLLNPNRNPDWSEADAERILMETLGVEKVLWLDEGLANDHTDGHIDNLARFIAPGIVVCQSPVEDDPNADVLEEIALTLAAMRDARGRKLEVIRVPSPGRVLSDEGKIMPASHVNFITSSARMVVPVFADPTDELYEAFGEVVKAAVPKEGVTQFAVMFASAKNILSGGGAFHCITRQEPA
jgi:agmatine deiminase